MLVQASRSDLRRGLRRFARQPKNLGDGIANGLDVVRPLVELLTPIGGRQMQPVGVVRQIERAGSAGNGASMPDRRQKFTCFQRVNDLRARLGQLLSELADMVDQLREPCRIDSGLASITAEVLGMSLELFADVRAHVAPS